MARLVDKRGTGVGEVRLTEGDGGVRVAVTARGLDPGFHGFHVHTIGVCDHDDAFDGAGPHLGASPQASHPDHSGDLPALFADQAGRASATFHTRRFGLSALLDGDGTAFIITSERDNFANIPTDRYDPDPDEETRPPGQRGQRPRGLWGGQGRRRRDTPSPATGWLRPTGASSTSATLRSWVGGRRQAQQAGGGYGRHRLGDGYWLVASDGGVFNYGDATFKGSTGRDAAQPGHRGHGRHPLGGGLLAGGGRRRRVHLRRRRPPRQPGGTKLNSPIVGMAATPTGAGYWLFAADGGVFTFGDAGFAGSTGGTRLNRPIVGAGAFTG